jgi:DNA-binding transcriptional ArsR family regulator
LDNTIVHNGKEGVVASNSTRGRGEAVTMLPLFRSQTQALVLTRLLLGPGEESITDLANTVGAYKNAVKHEVDRLEAAGLVSSRSVGRSRLVSVSAEEPVRGILLDLVLHTYGPVDVVGGPPDTRANLVHRRATLMSSWSVILIAMTSLTRSGEPPHDWVRRSTSTS